MRITLELPDTTFDALRSVSEQQGQTPSAWLAARVPEILHEAGTDASTRSSKETEEFGRDFELRFFGAVDSGDPRAADNVAIDRDLALEYAL